MSSWIFDGGIYEWVIANDGNEYGAGDLISGKLTDAIYGQISVGNVVSRQLNLEMLLTDGAALNPEEPIELSFKKVDSNGYYVPDAETSFPKGVYFIDTLDKSPYSDEVGVTAFDALLKAEAPYMKTGTWGDPIRTDYSIARDIAGDIGVELETATKTLLEASPIEITQVPNIGDSGTTMREMLSVVASLHGGNWIINDNNELELIILGANTPTVSVGDEMMDFDVSPTETVKRVVVWAGSSMAFRAPTDQAGDPLPDDEWEEIGGAILTAQMPIMGSQDVANALYTQCANMTYVPYSASGVYIGKSGNTYYGPDAKLGVNLTFKTENPVTVVLSNRSINIDALAAFTLSARATIAEQGYYPYMSAVERDIKRQTDSNTASITVHDGEIEAVAEKTTDNTNSISKLRLDADSIDLSFNNFKTGLEDYIRYDSEQHWLELGERGDETSPFKARLSRTELAFTGENGQNAAWISNSQLNIAEAVITRDQRFLTRTGTESWTQEVTDNDHFRIRWSGGN